MDIGHISLPNAPALGFDLDLTLIDMRAATAYALRQVNAEMNVRVDIDAVLADLGAPFREQLAQWIPRERIKPALRVFLGAFMSGGLSRVVPLPGAAAVLAAVAELNGRAVVVTGRRGSVARACLRRCGMTVAAVTGGVTGTEKAPAMRRHRIDAFIGDHPLDMAGALAAQVPGIGVLTGARSAEDLLAAGATAVVATLEVLADQLAATAARGDCVSGPTVGR